MPMMSIRIMWMLVSHRRMAVPMDMRSLRNFFVVMVVMVVMNVGMSVFMVFVFMLMFVHFSQVQPYPKRH